MSKSNKNKKKNKFFDLRKKIISFISESGEDFSLVKFILKWIMVVSAWSFVIVVVIISYYSYDLPSTNKLMESTKSPNIKILNESGELVANYGQYYGSYMD